MFNSNPPPALNLNTGIFHTLPYPPLVSPYPSPRFSEVSFRSFIPTGAMECVPIPIPCTSVCPCRYFSYASPAQHLSSPLLDYNSQLPQTLVTNPQLWTREDVKAFLRWAEKEYDLQSIDLDKFQMNGLAMCLLTKSDLLERAPCSGDVLHNILQLLVRNSNLSHQCLPCTSITPTSRHHYLEPNFSTPNGTSIAPNASDPLYFTPQLAPTNFVTLGAAPSLNTQTGTPQADSENERQQDTGAPSTSSADTLPAPAPYLNNKVPNCRLLWDFLQQLLNDPTQKYDNFIAWKNRDTRIFKIVDPRGLAKLWGRQKNIPYMDYNKMSRALRYYYKDNILKKVQGKIHCYQFLKTYEELIRDCKNRGKEKTARVSKTRKKLPENPQVTTLNEVCNRALNTQEQLIPEDMQVTTLNEEGTSGLNTQEELIDVIN